LRELNQLMEIYCTAPCSTVQDREYARGDREQNIKWRCVRGQGRRPCVGVVRAGGCGNCQEQRPLPQAHLASLVLPPLLLSIELPRDSAGYEGGPYDTLPMMFLHTQTPPRVPSASFGSSEWKRCHMRRQTSSGKKIWNSVRMVCGSLSCTPSQASPTSGEEFCV
jgi:hypothetical protein